MEDMISRQDAIDEIREYMVEYTSLLPPEEEEKAEGYNDGLETAISALAGLPPAQQWISCEEKLPEDNRMKISVDKYVKQQIDIEIEGITLLSVEEAKQVSKEILAIKDWWWLRSPGYHSTHAANIHYFGWVDTNGSPVNFADGVVRPALKISNQESANLRIGDRFSALGCDWIYVLDGIALCNSRFGYHRFDASSNDWEKSELKAWLENWFAKKMEEQK